MSRKPDRITAMQQIIGAVKQEFPLYQPDTFRCGPDNSCIGGPKKLMELVDTDLSYWQYQIDSGIPPPSTSSTALARCARTSAGR
ncbi:hypothetical protein P5G63_13675 [Aeromonas salmonicida]|nr:hypothetical protein [Aeromonas salmonicida]MDF8329481.1 hypothetical protein [Aeromonas salmonicida]